MGARVIHIQESSPRDQGGVMRVVDPAGTALMLAISGTVLAASLLVASMSTAALGQSLTAGVHPEPAPPPTLSTPQPGSAPASP
jgi:hypothetical protein